MAGDPLRQPVAKRQVLKSASRSRPRGSGSEMMSAPEAQSKLARGTSVMSPGCRQLRRVLAELIVEGAGAIVGEDPHRVEDLVALAEYQEPGQIEALVA